jgi:hypothetical protein
VSSHVGVQHWHMSYTKHLFNLKCRCYIELSHIFPVLVLQISVRWRHFMCIMNFQYIYKFKMIDIFRVLYFLHFRFITLSFVYELHIFLSEHVVFLIFMLRQKSSFCCWWVQIFGHLLDEDERDGTESDNHYTFYYALLDFFSLSASFANVGYIWIDGNW